MKERIRRLCRELEKQHNVRILFAVENGSRAWHFASKDSDYDVRFVFVRQIEDYIRIRPLDDVITAAYDQEGKPCPVEGSLIDMSGFDVFKFTTLLASSNPTTIEWLISDIIYYGKQNRVFVEFARKSFSTKALYFHYKSMCKNNYLKYLKSGADVTYKKYLYAMRGLLNARWGAHRGTLPPIGFTETLAGLDGIIPEHILARLRTIITLKARGKEKEILQNVGPFDAYIEAFLGDDSEVPPEKIQRAPELLDAELRKIVLRR